MTSELKVGVLFVAGVALALTFTVFATPSLHKRGDLSVRFPRIQRLKAGDAVTYNGVKVGAVSAVEPVLTSDGNAAVSVIFAIEPARRDLVRIGPATRYTIRQGVLGGAELEILSTGGEPITPAALNGAVGVEPVGIDDAVASIRAMVDENRAELKQAIAAVNKGMTSFGSMSEEVKAAVAENRPALKSAVISADRAFTTIDQTVGENRKQLSEAIANFRDMGAKITTVVEENRQQISDMLKRFTEAGTSVRGAGDEVKAAVAENRPSLKKTIDNAATITDQVAQGKGSLGKLVMEDTAHDKLEATLDSAQQRLEEVKPFTQGISDLRFYGGVAGGRDLRSGVATGEAYLRIEPKPWKFYEVGVGYRTAGDDRDIKTEDPDKLSVDFNLLLGWRWLRDDDGQFYRVGAAGGLIETRLGARAWWNLRDDLALSAMVRQAHNTRQPDDRRYEAGDIMLRASLDWTVWRRVTLSVGANDIAYKAGPWVALRGEILDNDLRNLFTAASLKP